MIIHNRLWGIKNLIYMLIYLINCSLIFGSRLPDLTKGIINSSYIESSEAAVIKLLDNVNAELKENPLCIITKRRTIYLVAKGERQDILHWIIMSPEAKLKKIKAWIADEKGEEKKIGKENIFETQLDPISFFTERRKFLLTIPLVKKNYRVIVESETEELLEFPTSDFLFYRDEPIETLYLRLKVPEHWQIKFFVKNFKNYYFKKINNREYEWKMEKIKEVPDLAFLPKKMLSPIIIGLMFSKENQSFQSWEYLSKYLEREYEKKYVFSKEIEEKVNSLIKGLNLFDGIKAIAEFVQKEIRYVSIERHKKYYIPNDAVDTFHKLYGDCKDKTALLISMLKIINVKSYAVACTPRDLGNIDENYFSITQFNHLITAIELPPDMETFDASLIINNKHFLFFDPTNLETPFGMLPYPLQGTKALIISSEVQRLIKLPEISWQKNLSAIYVQSELDRNGNIIGSAKTLYYGMDKIIYLSNFNFSLLEKFKESYIATLPLPSISIDEFEALVPSNLSSPFIIKYKFFLPNCVQILSKNILIKPILFDRITENPFVSQEYNFPIMFPYAYSSYFNLSMKLPKEYYLINNINVEVKNNFAEYKLEVIEKDDVLYIKRIFSLKNYFIPEESYKDIKDFFYKVYENDSIMINFSK